MIIKYWKRSTKYSIRRKKRSPKISKILYKGMNYHRFTFYFDEYILLTLILENKNISEILCDTKICKLQWKF